MDTYSAISREQIVTVSARASAARQIGQAFAEVVGREPSARRLWVSARDDAVRLWLLTDPLDLEAERRLYPLVDATAAVADGAFIRLHVLNPQHGENADLCSVVPADSVEIALHPART